ncbi:ATP-binding protein [Streptomyces sp. NPDC086783]|uniref:ATP-binding protein n=1 Tax=Streptomyces sp. NPDC086783 TaxID=3365758 RepID=UPI003821AB28
MNTERHSRHVNNETAHSPRERFYRRERRSVPAAREFTRAALSDWGVPPGAYDDILLCAGELTTNALVHGVPPGRGLRLRLVPCGDLLRVEVHDSGGGEPRVTAPAEESGRGLLLVAALADKWGVAQRNPGKIVWCEFSGALRPPHDPSGARPGMRRA